MDSRPFQCAAIAVAFFLGRSGSIAGGPGPVRAGTAAQETAMRADTMSASRLLIAKDKPAAEGCQGADDVGKVRVYVGDFHYVARLTHPTYPPKRKPVGNAESRPSLWFCAWDREDPDRAVWYEVPGIPAPTPLHP